MLFKARVELPVDSVVSGLSACWVDAVSEVLISTATFEDENICGNVISMK